MFRQEAQAGVSKLWRTETLSPGDGLWPPKAPQEMTWRKGMKTEPSSEVQGLPASGSGLLSLLSKDSNPASARGNMGALPASRFCHLSKRAECKLRWFFPGQGSGVERGRWGLEGRLLRCPVSLVHSAGTVGPTLHRRECDLSVEQLNRHRALMCCVIIMTKRPTAGGSSGSQLCLSASKTLPGTSLAWASATPTVKWANGLHDVLHLLCPPGSGCQARKEVW